MRGLPFDFEIPVSFFEKADAEVGKQKRIGGIVSLETKDRQDETVLQRGLDFNDFRSNGWFNDNHSRATDAILGYPEKVQYFNKGANLPDGKVAPASGHWVEGYLLETEKANRIWELGKALQKTNRRLGFSVEGKIKRRTGPSNKTIAKALVRNVAITNCPVNTDSRMEILSKSIQAIENADPDELEKTLGMGTAHPGQSIADMGPQTGMGAGQVITPESLEKEKDKKKKKKKKIKKSLSDIEAFKWLSDRLPLATPVQIGRLIELTKAMKNLSKI